MQKIVGKSAVNGKTVVIWKIWPESHVQPPNLPQQPPQGQCLNEFITFSVVLKIPITPMAGKIISNQGGGNKVLSNKVQHKLTNRKQAKPKPISIDRPSKEIWSKKTGLGPAKSYDPKKDMDKDCRL